MNTNTLLNTGAAVLDQASVAVDQASHVAQRGAEAVRDTVRDTMRDGVQVARDKAANLSDHTVSYIKDEPVKSVLIAAAAGATLMGLLSLMVRGAGRG